MKYALSYENERHHLLEDGQVVYENADIIYVGKHDEGQVDAIIDEKKNLLLPGFIDLDALGDADHSLIFIGFPQERRDDLVRSRD